MTGTGPPQGAGGTPPEGGGPPPGWWLASDGRWYPPELHPSRRSPAAPASTPDGPAPNGVAPNGVAPNGLAPNGTRDSSPFAPVPEHPPLSPLSMRQTAPRRRAVSSAPDDLIPANRPRHARDGAGARADRRDLSLGPASLASGTPRPERRAVPLGIIFIAVAVLLAAGIGAYWYLHRPTPHSSSVNAAETFVRAVYDDTSTSAQSMLVPGQQLDVPKHAQSPVSFYVSSVTRNGGDSDVNLVVCLTGDGAGCGAQSDNGTPATVPTREIDGSWYVDQSLIQACTDQPGSPPTVVCQN